MTTGRLAGLALGIAMAASPTMADTLYVNSYDPSADAGNCLFSSACAAHFSVPSVIDYTGDVAAQGFALAGNAIAASASFTELDGTQLVGPSSVNWAYYTNASGVPGAVVASGTASIASDSSAGPDVGTPTKYVDTYTFNTGSVALGPGSYFLALQTTSSDINNYLAEGLDNTGAAESLDNGATWAASYEGIGGVAVEVDGAFVPEPASIAMFGMGLAMLRLVRRRA